MPTEQAIETLRQALSGNPAVNVLVASKQGTGLVLQRLNLQQNLATEFLSAVRAAIPTGEVAFRPYEPGYTPDRQELVYIDLSENEPVAEQIRLVSQVQQAELFSEQDRIVDHLRFYAVVVSPNAGENAVFFRTYSPKKELTRKIGFAAFLSRGQYDKIESKIFLFDRQTDCFSGLSRAEKTIQPVRA